MKRRKEGTPIPVSATSSYAFKNSALGFTAINQKAGSLLSELPGGLCVLIHKKKQIQLVLGNGFTPATQNTRKEHRTNKMKRETRGNAFGSSKRCSRLYAYVSTVRRVAAEAAAATVAEKQASAAASRKPTGRENVGQNS